MKEKIEKRVDFLQPKIWSFFYNILCLHYCTNGSNNIATTTISTLHNYIIRLIDV